jgi:cyanate lyase
MNTEIIKQKMKQKGLTAKNIADLTGLSLYKVYSVINGDKRATLVTAQKVLEVLDLRIKFVDTLTIEEFKLDNAKWGILQC